MIELGGGIFLENFDELDKGMLSVIKKIIGNYTRKISSSILGYKKIVVCIKEKSEFEIHVKVEADKSIESIAKNKNLFFALDKALAQVLE